MSEDFQAQRRDLLFEKDSLRVTASNVSKRMTTLDTELRQLDQKLQQAERFVLRVSDHAVLQYLARKYKLNLEDIRLEILPQDEPTLNAIIQLGDGIYPVTLSHRVIVKDSTIVTIIPAE